MLINTKTRQALDFDRVLSELIPSSPFGVKCKSDMKPYLSADAENLAHELNRVYNMKELLHKQPEVIRDIKVSLKQIKDIHRSIERCMEGGTLNQVELFELKSLIFIMHSLNIYQSRLQGQLEEKYRIYELPKVIELLDPQATGIRSFYIYDEYSEKLQNIRLLRAIAEQKLEQLKKRAIEEIEQETGLKLKSTGEFIASKNHQELLTRLEACENLQQSGETFINVTYRIKPSKDMAQNMKEIEDLKGEEFLEEVEVLQLISYKLGQHCEDIITNISAIGELDLLIAKAELALRHNGTKPELTRSGDCIIKNGINPIVQKELLKKGKSYMPISTDLYEGVTLITGANMGGKTVSMKLLGLLAGMAQYGLLVPAEHMSFHPFDYIYISCGDEQSVDLGLSTFGGEIKSITEVLSIADHRGLILLDELARGTNPKEGYAISYAIIDYLMKKPCVSVVTTHLEGLERTGVRHLQVKGLQSIAFEAATNYQDISLYMDYSLVEVRGQSTIPEDAIKISRIMGMPEDILIQAENIMKEKYKP